MARRGFLRRIADILRREPPDVFRRVWDENYGRGSYRKHRDFFDALPAIYDSRSEEIEIWTSYVRNMVNAPRGTRRNSVDNPFWSDIGLQPRAFDWSGWRQAMGYKRRR